jgi:DNA-binding CsgD family transcriptional regulator
MPRRVDVELSEEEREVLERWARRPSSAQALALRCQIVLAAADGEQSKEIAARLGCADRTPFIGPPRVRVRG